MLACMHGSDWRGDGAACVAPWRRLSARGRWLQSLSVAKGSAEGRSSPASASANLETVNNLRCCCHRRIDPPGAD